jgi:hypothetical protein
MHLAEKDFLKMLPDLIARGFPGPDPTTGNFDLGAIDLWRMARHPRLYGLTPVSTPEQPSKGSMGDRFNAAKKRGGHGTAA